MNFKDLEEKCRRHGISPTKQVDHFVASGECWKAEKLAKAVREAMLDFGDDAEIFVNHGRDSEGSWCNGLVIRETVRRTESEVDDMINQSEPF